MSVSIYREGVWEYALRRHGAFRTVCVRKAPQRDSTRPADELAQRLLAAAQERIAVGEEKAVEVAVEKPGEGLAEAALDGLGIVAQQAVGDEAQLAVVNQPVGEREKALVQVDVQGGL